MKEKQRQILAAIYNIRAEGDIATSTRIMSRVKFPTLPAMLIYYWRRGWLKKKATMLKEPKTVIIKGKAIKIPVGTVEGCIWHYSLTTDGNRRLAWLNSQTPTVLYSMDDVKNS